MNRFVLFILLCGCGAAEVAPYDAAVLSADPSDAAVAPDAASGIDAAASPSAEPLPIGDLPGWRQVFTDDFLVDAALGAFPGSAYAAGWSAYPDGCHDTSGNGAYSPERTLSVAGGVLNIRVHTEAGVHYVAAPLP